MVNVDYFNDLLCVWAYGGQVRLDEMIREYGDRIQLNYHFIPIFASARSQIEKNWQERQGFKGFNQHLKEVSAQWPHVDCHQKLWLDCQPTTSTSAHLVLKAVALLEQQGKVEKLRQASLDNRTPFEHLMWKIREAFFARAVDISRFSELRQLVKNSAVDWDDIYALIDNGEAFASLYQDDQLKQQYCLQGSPSYVLNQGRQILYGNVGYRIIQSNIEELLHREAGISGASWC